MDKQEIVKRLKDGWVGGMTHGDQERIVYPAMDEYAEQQSIAFFKWNAEKVAVYAHYLENIKKLVTSNEIEENLVKFEGMSIEERYQLFIKQNPTP